MYKKQNSRTAKNKRGNTSQSNRAEKALLRETEKTGRFAVVRHH
jgi:hypothetical protein